MQELDELELRHQQEWDERKTQHRDERHQLQGRHLRQLDGLDTATEGDLGEWSATCHFGSPRTPLFS